MLVIYDRRPNSVMLTGQDIRFAFSTSCGLASRLTCLKFDATGLDPKDFTELLKCEHLDSLTLNNAVNLVGETFRFNILSYLIIIYIEFKYFFI